MELKIEGMHCDACVRRVRQTLERTGRGAVNSVEIGKAEIDTSPDAEPVLLAALEKAGFSATVSGSAE